MEKETEAHSREGPGPRSRRRKCVLESSFPDTGHAPLSPHFMEMVDFRPQGLEKDVSMFNSCIFSILLSIYCMWVLL